MTPEEIIAIRLPTLFADTSRMNFYVNLAKGSTGSVFVDDKWSQAVSLRAMHLFSMDSDTTGLDASGPVTKKKEGELEVTYSDSSAVLTTQYPDLARTSFGRELIQLIRETVVCPMTRMC